MKKLILGLALSALAMTGAKASTLFTLECVEFYTASAGQAELDKTNVLITGDDIGGGKIKLTFDNTSTVGSNSPIVTTIGVYGAFSLFETTFSVINMPNGGTLNMLAGSGNDANDLSGGGVGNPGANDAQIVRQNQGGVTNGLNPDNEILMVEFTKKAGITSDQVKEAFKAGQVLVHMHFQSYPTGASSKGTAGCPNCPQIPEPSRALIGLVGIAGCGMIRRRRASK